MAIADVTVNMASAAPAGARWYITFQETPPGGPNGVVNVYPIINLSSATFVISGTLDNTKCYTIKVRARCQESPAIDGAEQTILVGVCTVPTCVTPNISGAVFV